jgi:tetratricopeptide (TPR) repeat protein
MRLEQGDLDGAREVARDLRDPNAFIIMHADKRFDAIVRSDADHYDVMKAFAARLTDLRARSASAPNKLAGINAVAEMLLKLNRAEDALVALSAALDRLRSTSTAFSDTEEALNWTLNARSRTLFALGRREEAFAALAEGARKKERGAINVSQAINLAEQYDYDGRAEEALAAVSALDFPNASEYGRIALEHVRACAYFQLGDKKSLSPILEYMRLHARDGVIPYLDTMIMVVDMDGAAALVIAELDDPVGRIDMLYRLQSYLPNAHAGALAIKGRDAWNAVLRRPDVAEAIGRVGRIEAYDVQSPIDY